MKEDLKVIKAITEWHQRVLDCILDAEYYFKLREKDHAMYFVNQAQKALENAFSLIPTGDKILLKKQENVQHRYNKFLIRYGI